MENEEKQFLVYPDFKKNNSLLHSVDEDMAKNSNAYLNANVNAHRRSKYVLINRRGKEIASYDSFGGMIIGMVFTCILTIIVLGLIFAIISGIASIFAE